MEALKPFLERVSIRRFQDRALPEEVVEKILLAGVRAPSGGIFQAYCFIVVKDRDKLAKIGELTGQRFVKKAPLFILVCVDLRRFRRALDMLGHDYHLKHGYGLYAKLFSVVEASIAADSMAMAASLLGLGTCFVGAVFYRMAEVAELLGLPEGVIPLMGLCIGYPGERPPLRPRWPVGCLVHVDGYRDPPEEEVANFLREADRALGEEGYYKKYAGRGYGYVEHLRWKTQISDWLIEREEKVADFMRRNGLALT